MLNLIRDHLCSKFILNKVNLYIGEFLYIFLCFERAPFYFKLDSTYFKALRNFYESPWQFRIGWKLSVAYSIILHTPCVIQLNPF